MLLNSRLLSRFSVNAMVCMLTQGNGQALIERISCVRCATHLWQVEDELQLYCPAYSDIRIKYASPFQHAFNFSDLVVNSESKCMCCFSQGVCFLYEVCFIWLTFSMQFSLG